MKLSEWNVVVVEDEVDSRELVQELLSYHGIKSVAAPTAEDALHILKSTVSTLIIIDLSLPGMDGWSLLTEIRSISSLQSVPCVAITAYHTAEVAHEAIKAGFDAYFAKPLDATTFVRELVMLVEEHQQ